ncbi:unnamed protein product [Phytophthora lilii]|uniref:Unnamed protein product n=1 Tax=Phytophthora lilii TaxID=2077276 RepID=A0A9W6TG06_9STRA|nr:unnamed protein product [Phytophthora lilii]
MDNKLEEGVEVTKPHRIGVVRRVLLGCREFWTGMTVIPTFVLVLIGLMVFGLAMETRIISCMPEVAVLNEEEVCSPTVLNASTIKYHSGHRYYATLKEMDPPVAPTFRGKHAELCDAQVGTDRTDLLNVHSPKSVCYASVLHMLMVEVYEELLASGNTPLITFGSLLGAVRNGSMIPFTEDTDIGFVGQLNSKDVLQQELWNKGYHMFFMDIWRVCVAPTHPLASRLYDPSLPLTKNFAVPYVDLYMMRRLNDGNWDLQELQGSNGRLMPYNRVEPFSQVTINGMPFNTVHDPHFFLTEAYGPNYMTPKPRTPPLAPSVKQIADKVKEVAKRLAEGAA